MPHAVKELMYKRVLDDMKKGTALFFARVEGLTVKEFEELRRQLDRLSERVFVAKNTLVRRALDEMGAKASLEFVEGQVLLVSSRAEPQEISKVLIEFAKGREKFKVQGAILEDQAVRLAFLQELARLPARRELLAALLGRMVTPATRLVMGLQGAIRSLAIALHEVAKKKGEGSGS